MEHFYDYLKGLFFVDNENKEIGDLLKAVDELLYRYANFIKIKIPGMQIERLQSSGSMVEQTRIWEHLSDTSRNPDLEFDYLAVLKLPREDITFTRFCPGHMRVFSDTDVDTFEKKSFNLNDIVVQFWKSFVTVVTTSCSCFEMCKEQVKPFAFMIDVITNNRGCGVCTVTLETGKLQLTYLRPYLKGYDILPIRLEWNSYCRSLQTPKKSQNHEIHKQLLDKLVIHVDLLPAFAIEVTNVTKNEILGKRNVHQCYLIPKHCQQHEECWRISYCLSEIEMLQSTTQAHRDVYKLLKVFQLLFRSGLKSYHIKTALLHHITKCRNEQSSRHDCLQKTLNFLVDGMINHKMPHTIEGLNLREVFSEISLYLYQAQLFYVVLNNAIGGQNEIMGNRKNEVKRILEAYSTEHGDGLYVRARRVASGERFYEKLLIDIIQLGEWVSKKRVNEYRDDLQGPLCAII